MAVGFFMEPFRPFGPIVLELWRHPPIDAALTPAISPITGRLVEGGSVLFLPYWSKGSVHCPHITSLPCPPVHCPHYIAVSKRKEHTHYITVSKRKEHTDYSVKNVTNLLLLSVHTLLLTETYSFAYKYSDN